MPLVRRKKVVLHEVPNVATPNAATPAASDVFYIPETGEIFADYESYSNRMAFYSMKVFQCELTGKSGLDYFQALASERSEATTLHARFPTQLKGPVLSTIQWQIMGRLDHLVELVYDRFVNRYFVGEKVFVDVDGEKYYARIARVLSPGKDSSNSTSSASPQSGTESPEPHAVGVDLQLSPEEAARQDDPMGYTYGVRLIEEPDQLFADTQEHPLSASQAEKWPGSEKEVHAGALSRDRLSFSKSILRRFIRDCVDRDAAVASPWTVKRLIAEQLGIATEIPDDVRKAIDGAKAGEKEKRKKVWEDKHEAEGIPPKRRKKEENTGSIRFSSSPLISLEAQIAVTIFSIDSNPATLVPAPMESKTKPKGPVKYPVDDLEVVITDREKRAGKQVVRPPLSRDLPFGRHFETFLMAWVFFQSFSVPLKISVFSLDDFENALRHSISDLHCHLLAEIHHCLLYAARERIGTKYIALESLELETTGFVERNDVSTNGQGHDLVSVTLSDIGREAKGLGYRPHPSNASTSSDGVPRPGWEDNVGIYLRDHATIHAIPNLRRILSCLMFEPIEAEGSTSYQPCPPAERYVHLLLEDKLAIISYLIEICTGSRQIRAHVEWADSSLTELRKEKIEVNREKRRLMDEITQLDAKIEPTSENNALAQSDRGTVTPQAEGSSPIPGGSEEEELLQNDHGSDGTENPSTARRKRSSNLRRTSLKANTSGSPAKTVGGRAQARMKAAEAKSALAERRKLEEELNRHEKRLESIEREFRQLFGVGRTKLMGKDRFFNRYWWLDGMGAGQLVTSNGSSVYGVGRLFVQGPNTFDLDIIASKGPEAIRLRQEEEDGEGGPLKPGQWAVYSEPHEVEGLLTWLNTKGHRELALKNQLTKWIEHIIGGMKRRQADLAIRPERRSTRGTKGTSSFNGSEGNRDSYLSWTNRYLAHVNR